jgi:hydrogenase maturation protein HypF
MAEMSLEGEVVGAVADSTGYGEDGAIWGCEVMAATYTGFERKMHLKRVPMPGPKAVRSPLWSALAFLESLGPTGPGLIESLFPSAPGTEISAALACLRTRINTYPSSSLGRLLDAAAAVLGVCLVNTYEGEGAALMDDIASWPADPYSFTLSGETIDLDCAFNDFVRDVLSGRDRSGLAGRFIATCGFALSSAAIAVARDRGISRVAFSGGVFQSPHILSLCKAEVERVGLEFYANSRVPANDGGLALGQACCAASRLKRLP